jgi:hypothetical protein
MQGTAYQIITNSTNFTTSEQAPHQALTLHRSGSGSRMPTHYMHSLSQSNYSRDTQRMNRYTLGVQTLRGTGGEFLGQVLLQFTAHLVERNFAASRR